METSTSRAPRGPWLRIPPSQPTRLSDRISLTPLGETVADGLLSKDTGCPVSPHCRDCPLARCALDHPAGPRRGRVADRDAAIIDLVRRGWKVAAVARAAGVSRRHAYRIIDRTEKAS